MNNEIIKKIMLNERNNKVKTLIKLIENKFENEEVKNVLVLEKITDINDIQFMYILIDENNFHEWITNSNDVGQYMIIDKEIYLKLKMEMENYGK